MLSVGGPPLEAGFVFDLVFSKSPLQVKSCPPEFAFGK